MTRYATACAFDIPTRRVVEHFRWNHEEYRACGVRVLLSVRGRYDAAGIPDYVTQVVYPWPMPVYSTARATNYVLRRACDDPYCSAVVRTDIDVCFGGELAALFHGAEAMRRAVAPLYFMADSYESRMKPCYCAYRAEGTIALAADLWRDSCGYNERYVGYGRDDGEMVARLASHGIPIWRWHRVYHIAHRPGTSQVEAFLPDSSGQARADHWNPKYNPMKIRREKPSAIIVPESSGWNNPDWGKIDWSKAV